MIKGRYVAQVEVDFHINDKVSDAEFNDMHHQVTTELTNFIKETLDFELGGDDGLCDVNVTQQLADLYRVQNERGEN